MDELLSELAEWAPNGCENLPGDANSDGIFDILDLVLAVNVILTGGMQSEAFDECVRFLADYTGDEITNVLDLIQLMNYILR